MEIDKIYLGDCLELMKEIPDKSIDCIICDYYKFHRAFECFEFTDGTPFGIKEE